MKKLEECLLLLKEGTVGRVKSTFSKLYKSKNEEDRQKARDLFIDACNKALSPWGSTDGIQKVLNAGKDTVKDAIEELGLKNVWINKYFPELEKRKNEKRIKNLDKNAGIHNLDKHNEAIKNGEVQATNDTIKWYYDNVPEYKKQTGKTVEQAYREKNPNYNPNELDKNKKRRFLSNFLKREADLKIFKPIKEAPTREQRVGEKNPFFGKHHDEIEIESIRQTVKKNIASGNWHSGFNGRNNLSFAEKFFLDFFKNNLDNMRQPINNRYEIGYWMDFAWENEKVYIEVDGEQHYTEKGKIHDKERTDRLAACGWTLLERIRWSDYKKKKTEEERKNYLENILNKIKNKSEKFNVIVNDENEIKSGEVVKTIERI